jgi:hypothetical protein
MILKIDFPKVMKITYFDKKIWPKKLKYIWIVVVKFKMKISR